MIEDQGAILAFGVPRSNARTAERLKVDPSFDHGDAARPVRPEIETERGSVVSRCDVALVDNPIAVVAVREREAAQHPRTGVVVKVQVHRVRRRAGGIECDLGYLINNTN